MTYNISIEDGNRKRNSMAAKKVRILVAKAGLDGHDRGAKIVARAFRDAGFEVIYTGLHQTPEMIVNAAIDEDVDAISIGILSGAHNHIFPEILRLLKEKKASDIHVFGGGIIPEQDVKKLRKLGIGALFPPGTSTRDIIKYVKSGFKL